jgi:PTS system nitrogen regulatory IIA component
MSQGDFDINGLAEYLHVMPQQVMRLADRGKVPGRKVGGKWRFSRAEIHHWLEARIGTTEDDQQLAKMEGVLQRGENPETDTVSVQGLLSVDAIAVPLAARTRDSVITSMVDLACGTGKLWDPEKMIAAVRAREQMYPTALSCGVALLHPRRPLSGILSEAFLALGCTTQGIPFGGPRGQLTDIFILICSVNDQNHLKILARLSRLIGDSDLLDAIRESQDAEHVYQLLSQREDELTD